MVATSTLFSLTIALWSSAPLTQTYSLQWFEKTPIYTELLEACAPMERRDVDAVLRRIKVQKRTLKWVKKYASPLSRKKQRRRVRSVMPILLSKERVALGARFAKRHAPTLKRVSETYRVDEADLISMLNAESKFGVAQGDFIAAEVFVANMAYLPAAERSARSAYKKKGAIKRAKNLKRIEKRRRYSVENMATLLKYADSRGLDPLSITGSWAGAIGMTQFMPASLKWAKDGDSDGTIDLTKAPDAIASTANFLIVHGYKRGDLGARRRAFRAYNPNRAYVKAIVAYAKRFQDARRSSSPEK